MTLNTIDVLISTHDERVYQLERSIPAPASNIHFLIGHQVDKGKEYNGVLLTRDDVTYIPMTSTGVTKSRNQLLSLSTADIIYFADDDIHFCTDIFTLIRWAHKKYSDGIITFRVDSHEGVLRKKPLSATYARRNWLSILSVGTVEMTLKANITSGLRFNESMGAGSSIPIGDEAVFLSDALKHKIDIGFVNRCIATHPLESSGHESTSVTAYARGFTVREIFGALLGIPISLLFLIKYYSKQRHLNRLMPFLKAYCQGFIRSKNR